MSDKYLPDVGEIIRLAGDEKLWFVARAHWRGGGTDHNGGRYSDGWWLKMRAIDTIEPDGRMTFVGEEREGYVLGTGCFSAAHYLPAVDRTEWVVMPVACARKATPEDR